MPFSSRRQQRFAFATGQPWAKRWARETDFRGLPESKAAGTESGVQAHGPGGLLATPGMVRKWGKRRESRDYPDQHQFAGYTMEDWDDTKPDSFYHDARIGVATKVMTRSEAARAAALARWGKYTPKPQAAKPARRRSGGKGKDPATVARQQQRDQEHAQDRTQRQQDRADRLARQVQRDEERKRGRLQRVGDRATRQMTQALREQERKRQAEERAKKGSGGGGSGNKKQEQAEREAQRRAERAAALAARRADARRRAQQGERRDQERRTEQAQRRADQQVREQRREQQQVAREQTRQQERSQREQEAADRRRVTTPAIADAARRLSVGEQVGEAEQDTLIRNGLARRDRDGALVLTGTGLRASRQKSASFAVFKTHQGYRWITRSTTAYRDRDGEIISTKALEDDAARMTATGQYGPLRYWHIGEPDPFDPIAPWGPGLDIGECDYSIVVGRTSIESGTFKSEAIGQAFAEGAADYELSPGFFHPMDEPDTGGVYHAIKRFERSVVPVKYGRASNLFTGMAVKEHRMDQATYEARVKAYLDDMNNKGVPPEVAAGQLASMQQADKSAEQRGIAFKSSTIYYDPDNQPGIIQDGAWVALKAAPPEIEPETKADPPVALEVEAEPMDEGGQFIGDMTPAEFWAELQKYLAPVLRMQDMVKAMGDGVGELKAMYSGMATKDDSRAAEIAALRSQQVTIDVRLKALEGDQPTVVLPSEVEAALKSGGPQAPPSPDQPVVPNDPNRPYAPMAAALFPDWYSQFGS